MSILFPVDVELISVLQPLHKLRIYSVYLCHDPSPSRLGEIEIYIIENIYKYVAVFFIHPHRPAIHRDNDGSSVPQSLVRINPGCITRQP